MKFTVKPWQIDIHRDKNFEGIMEWEILDAVKYTDSFLTICEHDQTTDQLFSDKYITSVCPAKLQPYLFLFREIFKKYNYNILSPLADDDFAETFQEKLVEAFKKFFWKDLSNTDVYNIWKNVFVNFIHSNRTKYAFFKGTDGQTALALALEFTSVAAKYFDGTDYLVRRSPCELPGHNKDMLLAIYPLNMASIDPADNSIIETAIDIYEDSYFTCVVCVEIDGKYNYVNVWNSINQDIPVDMKPFVSWYNYNFEEKEEYEDGQNPELRGEQHPWPLLIMADSEGLWSNNNKLKHEAAMRIGCSESDIIIEW